MNKIDALVDEVYQKMTNMFLYLDELDQEKENLLKEYQSASRSEREQIVVKMKQNEQEYRDLSHQMTKLLEIVKTAKEKI